MATYGGVTFRMLAQENDGTITRPILVPEDYGIHRTKIPYGNSEHIQFTGRGNSRFTVKCEMYSDNDFTTLEAMVATGTLRTLVTEWGESLSNMLLVAIKDVWRVSFDEEIHFDATFEQV
jgi:hypothetical protein